MKPEEVIQKFTQYSQTTWDNRHTTYRQVAIDTMSIAILDGDIERFKQYSQAALKNRNGDSEQVAIDTLNMALMDRTEGRGGLIACLLAPKDKE